MKPKKFFKWPQSPIWMRCWLGVLTKNYVLLSDHPPLVIEVEDDTPIAHDPDISAFGAPCVLHRAGSLDPIFPLLFFPLYFIS